MPSLEKQLNIMDKLGKQDLFLSFYGDDFTGSTDVMESLMLNGIRTALFLNTPTEAEVKNFRLKKTWDNEGNRNLQAFGVAGVSRSLHVEQMKEELVPVFEKLSTIKTNFFHYKVCSTFDSSPEIGSIGFAIDLAYRYFPSAYIPLVVGAPFLNRFSVFGNLFARIDGVTHRLDRHPTMSRHPVTPMGESDLRLHLEKQTSRKIGLMDLFVLENDLENRQHVFKALKLTNGEILLFDTLSMKHLINVGEQIIQNAPKESCQLLVGSSSLEYALSFYLQKNGGLVKPDTPESPGRQEQIVVISGSGAPTTGKQLDWVLQRGFEDIRIDTIKLVDSEQSEAEKERVLEKALKALEKGKSIAIYTAKGPDDPAILATKKALANAGMDDESTSLLLGSIQGNILKRILTKMGKMRTVICGGDTSGHVAKTLEIYALETLMPISPGAPLCIVHSKNILFDGLEITLKGGQNGAYNYIESIKEGKNIVTEN